MTEKGSAQKLRLIFRKERVVEGSRLCQVLKASSRMTLYRHLQSFDYLCSYSDRGRYYTLQRYAKFDANGLWRWGDVCFSLHRTLRATLVRMIENSASGYYQGELRELLHVSVQDSLFVLVRRNQICRQEVEGKFLYISALSERGWVQLAKRREMVFAEQVPKGVVIEILAEVIRSSGAARMVEAGSIMVGLRGQGVRVTTKQVEHVLGKYGVKKTLD